MPENRSAQWHAGRGVNSGAGGAGSRPQNTTSAPARQAPDGSSPAYLRGELIYVQGRHLASVRNGELQRTFDATTELLRGSLLFRLDVLKIAERAGAVQIVATERASGIAYSVGIGEYQGPHSWAYCHPKFGNQLGLPLARFERVVPGQPRVRQLTLIEGEL